MLRTYRLCFSALLLIVLIPGSLLGQLDRATLSGTVTDATGAVVPGAQLEAVQEGTGLRRQATADARGVYTLTFLPIGRYTLTAQHQGFRATRVSDVALEVGESRTLDIQLQVGEVQTQVEVTAAATPLERTAATVGAVIESKQVQEIPLNGRHWASLMALAPGAINTGEGNQQSIRFFGRARDDNNWTFDGVDSTGVKDPRQETALRLIISTDSIAEFRVNSTVYTAESGAGAGAQINLVSKAGTNEFHGSVFEFLRNDVFDARGFFDPSRKPPLRLNQFGGSVGGPIIRDRTHFFANYEGLRQRRGQSLFGPVPSAAFRARATNPAIQSVLRAWPAGTARTANPDIDDFRGEAKQVWREDSGTIRVDHRFNDRTTMFARYNVDDGLTDQPQNAALQSRISDFRPSNLVVQLQRLITPALINEFKVGVNRSALHWIDTGLEQSVAVPGFFSLRDDDDQVEAGTSYALIDNVAWTGGRHTLKAGLEVRRIHVNVGNADDISVSFANRDSFLANRLESMSVNLALATRGARRTWYLGFVQDDFKLRPNLTLNLGLRYEYYSVAHEVRDRAKVFDFACGGFCPPGSTWYFPDRNNFDPRLGLAWSPAAFGNKTVIRAGFGVHHGPGQNDDVNAPLDSDAERFSLTPREAPNLSLPIAPFFALGRATGVTPRTLQRDRRDLYSQQWSFSVQQQLPLEFLMQVGYVGSSAHKLFSRRDLNVVDPRTGQRPLPAFGQFDAKENMGNSNFHGLQVSLQRSFIRGFLWGTEYMWSHAINDNSIGGGEGDRIQNTNCKACERGDSTHDIRHTVTANWVYELPFGPGKRFWNRSGPGGKVLEGWELSGIWTARTGRGITFAVSRSSADLPDRRSRDQRPNLVGPIRIHTGNPNCYVQWPANPACGSATQPLDLPPVGAWGNAGRNFVRGPGLVQFDLALAKRIRLTEGQRLVFRVEAFNLFNRTQFGNPATSIGAREVGPGGVIRLRPDPNFGRITSILNAGATGTGTPRMIQFSLRYLF